MRETEELDDEDIVICMTDEDGNEFDYVQEMLLEVDGARYAFLREIVEDPNDEGCDCGCEDAVIIAKVIAGDDGEDEYIEPTDEEFDRVQEAYDAIAEEDD